MKPAFPELGREFVVAAVCVSFFSSTCIAESYSKKKRMQINMCISSDERDETAMRNHCCVFGMLSILNFPAENSFNRKSHILLLILSWIAERSQLSLTFFKSKQKEFLNIHEARNKI